MAEDAEIEMRDEYELKNLRPSRHVIPLSEDDREYLRGKARAGDARAWRKLAGEQIRAAEQAIIAHWTLVTHEGVAPQGEYWYDAPEYDEIADGRGWFCGERYARKKTLTVKEVERAREIMERAQALAARLDAILRDHAAAQGWSDEELAERREVALYGARQARVTRAEPDPDEAHFVRYEVPDSYQEREKFRDEALRRDTIMRREMAAQEIRDAMEAFFGYRVIVHGDDALVATQRVRAGFYGEGAGTPKPLGEWLDWVNSPEFPEVLELDQADELWHACKRAEAVKDEYNALVEAHLASRGDPGDAIERRRMETAALWAAAA
ncbi:hypothetical protein [Longimicrobium sp.]|jgi:hypothetical protein|uniref:hypothetical protein n=1 Tax=Longimicrobium sp. TaxID=2029185 RepID=UPI002F92312A